MSKKAIRIYTEKDFTAADRLDRIVMAMMEPSRFILSESEDVYREKLTMAYAQVWEEYRQSEAIKWIQENVDECETWYKSHRVYADMCAVFGHFLTKNKAMQRAIVVEKFYAYAKRAEDDENIELAAKMLDKAAQLEGLYVIEAEFDPADFQIPAPIITSDPRVLRIQEPEDADFEDE
jgi:hypothetical protein